MKRTRKTHPYTRKELFGTSETRTFRGRQLDEIAFPLGGIGAGCISLGGWGQLRDWEIFNAPNKGYNPDIAFFALHTKSAHRKPVTRVLRGPQGGSYLGNGHGIFDFATGLPCFSDCTFTGQFPFARLALADSDMPVRVALEAFNPFIPLDADNSSLPVAIFMITLHNTSRRPVTARLFAGLSNVSGYPETGLGKNIVRRGDGLTGVFMSNPRHASPSPRAGSLALATPYPRAVASALAVGSVAHTTAERFWRKFEAKGTTHMCRERDAGEGQTPAGGLLVGTTIEPGRSVRIPILIAWHAPWSNAGAPPKSDASWQTHVGARFENAWDVARYTGTRLADLESRTRRFAKRLYSSSLPGVALEALGSQISILKATTCLRFADGGFWGWEGVNNTSGCCAGTCTHVWNYAQALPYLFPTLARSIHDQQFTMNMDRNGRMCFRQPLPPGTRANIKRYHAAADGQLGAVLRVYREWRISGNDEWLAKTWPACRKALEYAWRYWDANRDGVMEGVQHNTYDNEFWGPNTMSGSLYLGALRAAEEIARYLGDDKRASEYRRIFESGSKKTDQRLFNGKWYRQLINPKANEHTDHKSTHLVAGEKSPRYQYGNGCLSDQLIGQWYARMLGLGSLYKPANVRRALRSVFEHNWKPDMGAHACQLRSFAFPGDAGLIICTWPQGDEPPFPFWFSSEVWCGIEYQVAAHLIYEGQLEEGLAIVKGVRDRHDGTRRNPWDEFECGHHYSRSMASYALLLALSGFEYSAPDQRIGFAPQVEQDDFNCFFCVEHGWGTFRQRFKKQELSAEIAIDAGTVPLLELALTTPATPPKSVHARLGRKTIPCRLKKRGKRLAITFDETVQIQTNTTLRVQLG